MFDRLIAKKYKIKRNCHSCLLRHDCCFNFNEIFPNTDEWDNCKHWKLGKCYTCKFVDEPDDKVWYKRECETYCFGGCKKYKKSKVETKAFKELKGELK